MRVIVTASRTWDDPLPICRDLDDLLDEHGAPFVVVHGRAKGGDLIASDWVRGKPSDSLVTEEPHPADWAGLGRRAGIMRNVDMVAAGADRCLAYIRDGSPGASHCARIAEAAGIETRITRWPEGVA